jgi:hypothetical protein
MLPIHTVKSIGGIDGQHRSIRSKFGLGLEGFVEALRPGGDADPVLVRARSSTDVIRQDPGDGPSGDTPEHTPTH